MVSVVQWCHQRSTSRAMGRYKLKRDHGLSERYLILDQLRITELTFFKFVIICSVEKESIVQHDTGNS